MAGRASEKVRAFEPALKEKVEKYRTLTRTALGLAGVFASLSAEQKKIADDFLGMAGNYFSDAEHFREKGDLLNALAAYSYAHAWLDAGVRAKLFDAKGNDRLFTVP